MPRELAAWNGKPLTAPELRSANVPPDVPPASIRPGACGGEDADKVPALNATFCPQCSRGELRVLASGGLGCTACGTIFRTQETTAQSEAVPEPEAALDQIDAINAMLRRNSLVLAPGGVPLAQNEEQSRGSRRRHANSRRIR